MITILENRDRIRTSVDCKPREIRPWHIRMKEYKEAKDRIFKSNNELKEVEFSNRSNIKSSDKMNIEFSDKRNIEFNDRNDVEFRDKMNNESRDKKNTEFGDTMNRELSDEMNFRNNNKMKNELSNTMEIESGKNNTKIEKARKRYKTRKQVRQEIASAALYEGEDTRLYTRIKIAGEELEGLLDSGATVTCLGRGCLEFVDKVKIPIYPYESVIKTADGTPHAIIGRIRANIKLNRIENLVTFFLIPTLGRALYLGVDFMKAFKLVASVDCLPHNIIWRKPKKGIWKQQ